MWQIADGIGIAQSDGGILHQRTHALDPTRRTGIPVGRCPFFECKGRRRLS
jgi:hypothetical protein